MKPDLNSEKTDETVVPAKSESECEESGGGSQIHSKGREGGEGRSSGGAEQAPDLDTKDGGEVDSIGVRVPERSGEGGSGTEEPGEARCETDSGQGEDVAGLGSGSAGEGQAVGWRGTMGDGDEAGGSWRMKGLWVGVLLAMVGFAVWRGPNETPAKKLNAFDQPGMTGVWVDSEDGKFVAICCAESNGNQPSVLLMDKGKKYASLALSLDKANRPYMQVMDPETGELFAVDLLKLAKAVQ